MPSRELQTLLETKFAGTWVDVHGPVGVRLPRPSAVVNLAASTVSRGYRMVRTAICARAAGQVSALSPRNLAAVEARTV